MGLFVDIRKKLGSFSLDVQFEADQTPLALLGASGCGKSVTLRCIAGVLTPDEGQIILDGVTLFDSAAGISLPPQRRRMGYLFQQYALFPNMTVAQNIGAAVRQKNRRDAAVREKLRQFHLEDVAAQRPGQLSGGQQQRTALARILASEPGAILLDEPFSALDSYLKYQLELELTETLEAFPGPVVWVSHDRGEIFRSCQRICVLDQGCSQGVLSRRELFQAPGTEAAARLSGCKNFADAAPRGNAVLLPQWGLTLSCAEMPPPDIRRIGIRAHRIRFAAPGSENSFSCTVLREIEDLFSTILLLRPDGALAGAPALRMEASKKDWADAPDHGRVTVAVAPEEILLLR